MIAIETKLEHIKQAILKYVPARYIYLFGSYAYGEPTEESDIDIYTVVPDDTQNLLMLYGDIKCELDSFFIFNIDLLIVRENKYYYRKSGSMFEENICKNGRLIYEFN